MHKLTLLLAAFLFCSMATVSAQRGFEIGVGFTPTASFLLNKDDMDDGKKDYKGTFGFLGNAHVGYNFSDHFGISIGASYVSTGQKFESDNTLSGFKEQERKLEYIRVPLLFKFAGDPYATFTPYVKVGPHVDFLQNAEAKITDLLGGESTIDMNNYSVLGATYDTYTKDPVWGATLELGGFFNITDFLKLSLAFHVSSSFTNIETSDAKYFLTTGNNILQNDRANTFNTMVGGTVGLSFIIGGY